MAIPTTYNGLLSAVSELAEDDSQEFINYIPTAIYMAEDRLMREIDTEGMHQVSFVTAAPSVNTLIKPGGYIVGRDLSYLTSTGRRFVTKVTDDYLLDYWPNETSVGQPKYYADRDNTYILLAPAPASAYPFRFSQNRKPDHLGVSVTANYFSTECTDALYYATMVHMSPFMKDFGTTQNWEALYQIARDGINNKGRRERRDDGDNPRNPTSKDNTLKGDN